MQALVAEPMRDEVFRSVFVERSQIVTVEYVIKICANRCITLIHRHHEGSFLERRPEAEERRNVALNVMRSILPLI